MSRKFLAALLAHREVAPLLSDVHFSVDGTLIKAWASMQSSSRSRTTRRPTRRPTTTIRTDPNPRPPR